MPACLQDCNLVLYNGMGTGSAANIVYQSNTAGQGTPPCRLFVSSANGGSFSVLDSKNAVLFSR